MKKHPTCLNYIMSNNYIRQYRKTMNFDEKIGTNSRKMKKKFKGTVVE